MIGITDKITPEIYPVENPTLHRILEYLTEEGRRFSLIRHPERTRTVIEKKEMIDRRDNLYAAFRDIVIVKGSALCYHNHDGGEEYVAHFNEGETRIHTKRLKRNLGIPNKRDLRFFQGNLIELIGLDHGEVSPLMPTLDKLTSITFDQALLEMGEANHKGCYFFVFDMAITQDLSLYANIKDVYNALHSIEGDKVKAVELRPPPEPHY